MWVTLKIRSGIIHKTRANCKFNYIELGLNVQKAD